MSTVVVCTDCMGVRVLRGSGGSGGSAWVQLSVDDSDSSVDGSNTSLTA